MPPPPRIGRPFLVLTLDGGRSSSEGGAFPIWTRGGREIVYEDGHGRTMAATLQEDHTGELNVARAEPLFTIRSETGNSLYRRFDVTSDGQRFLFLDRVEASGAESALQLILIQNWTEELKRLVPREP